MPWTRQVPRLFWPIRRLFWPILWPGHIHTNGEGCPMPWTNNEEGSLFFTAKQSFDELKALLFAGREEGWQTATTWRRKKQWRNCRSDQGSRRSPPCLPSLCLLMVLEPHLPHHGCTGNSSYEVERDYIFFLFLIFFLLLLVWEYDGCLCMCVFV